jgi:hypothetical protein
MRIDNQKIYNTYEKSILEAKTGMRRRAQIIEDRIDDFFDEIERKIDNLQETPVFQSKMLQMLADATKEHNEFVMALKQICQTLDSGAKVIPKTKPHAKGAFPNTVDQNQSPDNTGVEDDATNQVDSGVAESFVPKGDSVSHIQKVYSGQYKVVATPNGSAYYVMGLTNNDNEYVPVTSAFATKKMADDFMRRLKKAEGDQKQMVTNKWKEGDLKKNNEYRPKEK